LGSIWLVVVVIATGATESLEDLLRQLYPREAGARSVFFPLLAR
jgi:hypothetical protein